MKFILSLFLLCAYTTLTQEDIDLQRYYNEHFQANYPLEDGELRIPETLHFIWLGPRDFPSSSISNLEKWAALHPNWRICMWTDRESIDLPKNIEHRAIQEVPLGDCYYRSENMGEKSEIARYTILLQEGGVYVDHDTQPLQSISVLNHTYDFYAGLEIAGPSVLSTAIFPSTHLIAAKPSHPILKNALQWLEDHWEKCDSDYPGTDSPSIYNRVKHRTFSALRHAILTISLTNRDIVFPEHYFSEKDSKKALYVAHQHQGTWYQTINPSEEKLQKRLIAIESKTNRLILLLITGLVLNLFFLVLLKYKKKLPLFLLPFLTLFTGCQKEETSTEFEKLMGKGTEHWKHLYSSEDKLTFNALEFLYDKNKAYLSQITSQNKIPKVIHFIWLGPKPFPPQSVENIRTWIAKNPGWRVKFWTDRNRTPPCSQMEQCDVNTFEFTTLGQCYHATQNYGEKSDILRYEILQKEGGVYADHDANCLHPFENLHANFDFYCGLEAPHPPFVGHNLTTGNGVLGARPGHPTIAKVIETIAAHWEEHANRYRGQDATSKTDLVLARTYMALTHSLKSTLDHKNNIDIVLPSAYFFAKTGIPSLYSKHFYATAWAEGNSGQSPLLRELEKRAAHLQKKETRALYLVCLLVALNGVSAMLFLFAKGRK